MTTLVLGVGHPDRGDDSAGPLVAELLAGLPPLVARCVESDPSMVLTDPLWDTAEQVIIVDTVRTGAPVGTVRRWNAAELLDQLPTSGPSATHDLGVATTIRLARALGRLPRALTVVGIEGAHFDAGEPPCHPVLAAVQRVAAEIDRASQERGSASFVSSPSTVRSIPVGFSSHSSGGSSGGGTS